MGAFLDLVGAVFFDEKPASSLVQPPSPTKTISYLELEKIIDSYLYSLTSDIEEILAPELQPRQRSLIKGFIKNHSVDFKYRLLKFFINHE